MNKRGSWVAAGSIFLVIILVCLLFYYFVSFKPIRQESQSIANPLDGLTLEQAELAFNESFVSYFLYSIDAQELHNPSLSDSKPIIWMIISGESYSAIIDNGNIIVSKEDPRGADIIIKTTKLETVKMIQDNSYVKESFIAGLSSIELVASKTLLFSKGYVNLYQKITGKSITGNVVRIYTD